MQELDIKQQSVDTLVEKPTLSAEAIFYEDVDLDTTVVVTKDIPEIPEYVKPALDNTQDVRMDEVERVKNLYQEDVQLTDDTLNVVAEELIEEGFVLT